MNDDAMRGAYVCDGDGKEISGLLVTSIQARSPSRAQMTPIEDGCQSIDNKVVDPMQVVVTGYVNVYGDNAGRTIDALVAMREDRGLNFCSVYAGYDTYQNLMLLDLSEERDSAAPDLVKMTLTFVEILLVQSSGYKQGSTSSPSHSSTTAVGAVSAAR